MRTCGVIAAIVVASTAAPARAQAPELATVTGLALDDQTTEALPGATVVAEPENGVDESRFAITDETGAYALELPPGTYRVTLFYAETTLVLVERLAVTAGEHRALGAAKVHQVPEVPESGFWSMPPASLLVQPHFGAWLHRGDAWLPPPVSRDRTVRAWIAPVVGADAGIALQTVADAPRFSRAPGIPLAFVSDVRTSTLRTEIGAPTNSGGAADVSLRTGSNEVHGDAAIIGGFDDDHLSYGADGASARGEAFLGVPIVHDHAWVAGGVVATREATGDRSASGMLAADYLPSTEHALSIAGIAEDEPDGRDAWARARWTSKLLDNRLEIHATAVGEALELSGDERATRTGGQLDASFRKRAAGYHVATVAIAAGTGDRDHLDAGDGTIALGDDWQVASNVTMQIGARVETRSFDGDRTTLLAPRASITWDPSTEARGDFFFAYQRVPRLDDGLPGDWRALARTHAALAYDELAAGVGWETNGEHPVIFGAAVRARTHQGDGDRAGVEAWAHVQREKITVHASATTLGNIASVLAGATLVGTGASPTLRAVATLRASPDATDGGAALLYRLRSPTRRSCFTKREKLAVDGALEGYDGSHGAGGRLVVTAIW